MTETETVAALAGAGFSYSFGEAVEGPAAYWRQLEAARGD